MWPWGHAALGYLSYRLFSGEASVEPSRLELGVLLVGTQFPDLVDKPLAWYWTVLPTGRSFAHSVLTLAAFCVLAYGVARRFDRPRLALAAAVGYASHLVGDALSPVVHGEFSFLTFLAWPLLPSPEYPTEKSFLAHFQNLEPTGGVLFGLALSLVALAAFVTTEYGHRWRD
ncbi:metal-dependent hydrolase [Haloarchaeobius sp. HRN-SO-5]|uniref:metal-dependent hydrolase n=1 Tax=Haloarchaeobius sp. HRN-SO-5 TaxID=3446118 RepID=UPI003EB871ED